MQASEQMPTQRTSKKNTGSVIEQPSFTIATLAARTGMIVNGPAVTRGGRMLSSSIQGGFHGGTAGNPPLMWGVMNGEFTLAELEAFLELNGPNSPVLKAENEVASRGAFIRTLGVVSPDPGSAKGIVDLMNIPLKGLKFSESGEGGDPGWDWWVYNVSAAKAFDTGGFFEIQCRNFVEWNPSG